MKRPLEVPEDVFLDELQFYEISEETILEYKVKEGFLIDKVCVIYTVLLNNEQLIKSYMSRTNRH